MAPMRILITGASGLVGSALVPLLAAQGHSILRLTRRTPSSEGELFWDPLEGKLDPRGLEGLDGVVHLAGEPIAGGRWTAQRKLLIRDSRVKGTALLCKTLGQLQAPPKVLVCASAIGIYGHRGDEILFDDARPGTGFLAEVGQQWEQASKSAQEKGIRVVRLRFGIILSPRGGALKMMLPAFRMGVAGRLGKGNQWMSWVSLQDAVGAILFALTNENLKGPANTVSPIPVSNAEFTAILARVLGKRPLLPVPALALRLLVGGLADEALLASARVLPGRLTAAGYRFQHPLLEEALKDLLRELPAATRS